MHLTTQGRRVLLVSTDPASNVGQVFGVTVGNTVTAVPDVPRLSALEIDPQQPAEPIGPRSSTRCGTCCPLPRSTR